MNAATKSEVNALALRVHGPGVYVVSDRTVWGTWRAQLINGAKRPTQPGRIMAVTSDYKSVGAAYGELAIKLRAREHAADAVISELLGGEVHS